MKTVMKVRVSMFSVLLVSFSACGVGGGGDAGLVPALLGLSPPSTAVSGETDGTKEAARSATTEPARPPSRIVPKPSSSSAPEQQQIVTPARDPNEPSADDKLRVIRRLRDRHLITDAEYESRRARILESN